MRGLLLSTLLCALTLPAAAQDIRTATCGFDSPRGESFRVTLIDEVKRKSRLRPVTLSLAIDGQPEVPAVTTFTSARRSPVGQAFLRVVARIDARTALGFQIAENGNGIFLPYDWETEEFVVKDGYPGQCNGVGPIIRTWR